MSERVYPVGGASVPDQVALTLRPCNPFLPFAVYAMDRPVADRRLELHPPCFLLFPTPGALQESAGICRLARMLAILALILLLWLLLSLASPFHDGSNC